MLTEYYIILIHDYKLPIVRQFIFFCLNIKIYVFKRKLLDFSSNMLYNIIVRKEEHISKELSVWYIQ